MKRFPMACVIAFSLAAASAFAAGPKTYQVTGPVLAVDESTITVQKDKDKWEIARDKDTKVTGELKVGAKVTIQYRMTAVSVEAKEDKPAAAKTPKKK